MTKNLPTTLIVIDIDNNLADNSHREHLLPTKDTPSALKNQQWIEFHNACDKDEPNTLLIDAIKEYYQLSQVEFVFISGRKDLPEIREKTEKWLNEQGLHDAQLLLRNPDSRSKSAYFKTRLIEKYLDHKNVPNLVIIEDNLEVINLFKNHFVDSHVQGVHVTPKIDQSLAGVNQLHEVFGNILNLSHENEITHVVEKKLKPF